MLAGDPAVSGNVDAQGAAARFNDIGSLAIDRAGTVYVADSATLRKVTPDGVVSTFAGSAEAGFADGVGTQARFGKTMGLTIDAEGNVLVADTDNQAIRKVTPQGVVSTLYRDQALSAFLVPGIAVDAGGRILYTALIGLFSAGNPSRIVAGTGVVSRDALFNGSASSISVDSRGDILRSDFTGGSLTRIAPSGAVVGFAGDGAALSIPKPPGGSFTGSQAIDVADNVYQIHDRNDRPITGGFNQKSHTELTDKKLDDDNSATDGDGQ